jgi:hypothetical protein
MSGNGNQPPKDDLYVLRGEAVSLEEWHSSLEEMKDSCSDGNGSVTESKKESSLTGSRTLDQSD